MNYTITGFSTALFSTWFFIEELGILFDAGDGVIAGLLQKSGKIKHVFLSHADRDHMSGLLQLNQLNARPGFPKFYYPKDSGSFPALAQFANLFDPHAKGAVWKPLGEGDRVRINDHLYVEAFSNSHVMAPPGVIKSLSYKLIQSKRKLKEEFLGLPGATIKQLKEENGPDFTTYEVRETLIGYSGDTPVENYAVWDNTNILIHEATFLEKPDEKGHDPRYNLHSTLEEVMEMVANINIGTLILSHFSTRYSNEKIDEKIEALKNKYAIKTPIYRVLPGKIHNNILNH